jgi:hypothetical protein
MLTLPAASAFGKRIPKQKFYDKLPVSAGMRRIFIDHIDTIVWRNKLSEDTLHLPKGDTVTEIEILQVNLKQKSIDPAIFELIDREIPYHLLFLLEYSGEFSARIGYKEANGGKSAFKVDAYYQTGWMPFEALPLEVDGLSLDAVYENFVRQVAGDALGGDKSERLQETVRRENARQKLERQIAKLESRMAKEKQFNRKVALNAEIKDLRNQLRNL